MNHSKLSWEIQSTKARQTTRFWPWQRMRKRWTCAQDKKYLNCIHRWSLSQPFRQRESLNLWQRTTEQRCRRRRLSSLPMILMKLCSAQPKNVQVSIGPRLVLGAKSAPMTLWQPEIPQLIQRVVPTASGEIWTAVVSIRKPLSIPQSVSNPYHRTISLRICALPRININLKSSSRQLKSI